MRREVNPQSGQQHGVALERLERRQPRSAQPEHLPATESRTRDLETVLPDLVVAPDPLDVAAAEELLDISAAVDVARDADRIPEVLEPHP